MPTITSDRTPPDTPDYAFPVEVGISDCSLAAGRLAAAKESQRSDKMKRRGSGAFLIPGVASRLPAANR